MRTLIFSDIHASKKACQELEKILPQFDRAVCCGDIVGYGKEPEYCLDFIVNNRIAAVKGNHDAMAVGESPVTEHPVVKESMEWTQLRLDDRYKNILRSLPESLDFEDVHLVHTLGEKYIYGLDDVDASCREQLRRIVNRKIVIGHSHVPFFLEIDGKKLVNPSSITKGRRGQPRGYAVYDGKEFELIALEGAAV